jgi:hypothetical protein
VVIEDSIPRNTVVKQKEKLFQTVTNSSTDHAEPIHGQVQDDDDDDDDARSVQSMAPLASSSKKDWMMLGSVSSASVADKKKWLSNAFPTNNTTTSHRPMISSARSDIVPSSSRRGDDTLGLRVKEKWRQNRTPPRQVLTLQTSSTDSEEGHCPAAMLDHGPSLTITRSEDSAANDTLSSMSTDATELPTRRESRISSKNSTTKLDAHRSGDSDGTRATTALDEPSNTMVPVDFRLARQLLVQRSKANGNDVEVVSAVKRRAAKFEAQRPLHPDPSHGLLKPAWEETKRGYVKKYRDNVAPKKDWSELP